MVTTITNVSVTDTWAALPSLRSQEVTIENATGADLEITSSSVDPVGTDVCVLADGKSINLRHQSTTAEWSIKADAGADGVTLFTEQ